MESRAREASAFEESHYHFDDFGIDRGRVGLAEDFCADLIELPVASFLRPLAAKHRANVVKFYVTGERLHSMFDIRSGDASRRLRPQGICFRDNTIFFGVGILTAVERIHFLVYDIGVGADRASKKFGFLENGEANFAEIVGFEGVGAICSNQFQSAESGGKISRVPLMALNWRLFSVMDVECLSCAEWFKVRD